MQDREKQIGEIVEVIRDTIGDYRMNDPYETAEAIYNANYRKMDEVTLKLDLGDRTPEQINEIMEKFRTENATPIYAGVSADELFELLKMLAENGGEEEYHSTSVQFVAQNTLNYINCLKEYAKAMECAYTTTLDDVYHKRNDEAQIGKQVAKKIADKISREYNSQENCSRLLIDIMQGLANSIRKEYGVEE